MSAPVPTPLSQLLYQMSLEAPGRWWMVMGTGLETEPPYLTAAAVPTSPLRSAAAVNPREWISKPPRGGSQTGRHQSWRHSPSTMPNFTLQRWCAGLERR